MRALCRRFAFIVVLCTAALVSPRLVSAQTMVGDLPRHGLLGLQVAPPDLNKPENPATNPPTVKLVAQGGAGEAAGIQVGDVLVSFDGKPVASSIDFAYRVSRHVANQPFPLVISRGGQQITKTITLKPRPFESIADADVIYTSVTAEGSRRRVIVTKPKAPGKHPALMLVAGFGCLSLDGELTNPIGYGPLLRAAAEKDFVTVRVEKTGEGDSEDPACSDLKATASAEAAGYLAGVQLLKSYDFVDPARVFIFAHSLGPLVNALVLPQERISGFIAAETVGRSWFEYNLENVRRQAALAGENPEEVDREVSDHVVCAEHYYTLHESSEAVAKISEQCAAMMRSYGNVPATLMQQIGDLSVGKQWKDVDVPVLVTYGTSDPVTSADEGQYLAELINRWHPGRATYLEFARMGHDFQLYDSQADFLAQNRGSKPHPYDEDYVKAVVNWLEAHAHG